MEKIRMFGKDGIGTEWCSGCDTEFDAPFANSVCPSCGEVQFGCNMCPLNYTCDSDPDRQETKAVCGGKNCPIPPFRIYAVFSRKELESLPEQYRYEYEAKKGYFHLLIRDRLETIYTCRKIAGLTTIDMREWREADDKEKKKLLAKTPKITAIDYNP